LVMNYQLPRDLPKNNVIEDLLYAWSH
jgi:hypothetical protein